MWWPLKGPMVVDVIQLVAKQKFNRRIRRGYVLDASEHRQHPWL